MLLAACSGAPKRDAGPPGHTAGHRAPPASAHGGARASQSRRSPYAAAQEDLSKRGDYVAGGLYAPHIQDSAPDYIPDVDAIPEPEVVDEPRSAYGNRSPYQVLGKSYHVLDDHTDFSEQGRASFYGNKFHGRRTSNLEVYDMYAFTAAHKSLPLPSFARVTNLENGRSVVVRVNDRGPFHEGRVVDLSWAAAVKLDMHNAGTAQVQVDALSPGENAHHQGGRYARRSGRSTPATAPVVAAVASTPTAAPVSAPATPSPMDRVVSALPIGAAHAGDRPPPTAEAAATTGDPPAAGDWRFDGSREGQTMSAAEFEAWTRARQIRVEDGASVAAPAPVRTAPAAQQDTGPAPATVGAPSSTGPVTSEPLAPVAAPAASAPAPAAAPVAAGVTLQVAAFGTRDNAQRALSRLQGAGVSEAQVVEGQSAGKPVWRLRVGPVAQERAAELGARVAGLGFGQPQIVRD